MKNRTKGGVIKEGKQEGEGSIGEEPHYISSIREEIKEAKDEDEKGE